MAPPQPLGLENAPRVQVQHPEVGQEALSQVMQEERQVLVEKGQQGPQGPLRA